jgi:hypothetical protein
MKPNKQIEYSQLTSKKELEDRFILMGATLTSFTEWLNATHGLKKTGKPFTTNDAFSYASKVCRLPRYMGNYCIIQNKTGGYGKTGIYVCKTTNEEEAEKLSEFYFGNNFL